MIDDMYVGVGAVLRQVRVARDLGICTVAKKMPASPTTVVQIENGADVFLLHRYRELCAVLEVRLSDVLGVVEHDPSRVAAIRTVRNTAEPIQVTNGLVDMLAVFVDNPGREFYSCEIAQQSGMSRSYVTRLFPKLCTRGWTESRAVPQANGSPRIYFRLTATGLRDAQAIMATAHYINQLALIVLSGGRL